MEDSTRRRFLAVAGTGAVGAAAGVALATAPGAAAAPAAHDTLPDNAEPALTAYVRDSKKGEVLLMSEGRQVVVTDPKLVARLAHAFAAASKK